MQASLPGFQTGVRDQATRFMLEVRLAFDRLARPNVTSTSCSSMNSRSHVISLFRLPSSPRHASRYCSGLLSVC